MAETILRHFTMLSLIPALPGKIAARDLHSRLNAQGFDVDVRSIERDLHKLSVHFPLGSDEARPAGWFWRSRESRLSFPRMDPGTALTYELLSRYLAPLLPKTMLRQLEPEFAAARRTLDDFRGLPLGRWSRRIAVLPFGQQLLPPEVKPEVSEIVYDALLKGQRFQADYRSANVDAPRRYTFNPLGLVYREGVLYLVASLWDYGDPRQFALQRMSKPEHLDEAATAPKGFDFQRYIREEKSFEYPLGSDITLELRVEGWLARHLEESRLSSDQVISPIRGSEDFRIMATISDTDQLFWWLRRLGTSLEVIKPAALRRKMAEQARGLAAMYGRRS
jgi:predicted DNA-binding transcriptional regulator YafY